MQRLVLNSDKLRIIVSNRELSKPFFIVVYGTIYRAYQSEGPAYSIALLNAYCIYTVIIYCFSIFAQVNITNPTS